MLQHFFMLYDLTGISITNLLYMKTYLSYGVACEQISVLFLQQALENSGLSVVQPQGDATSRESQNQTTDGAAVESKKVQGPDKPAREKKRSIFKKPIQMPGGGKFCEFSFQLLMN